MEKDFYLDQRSLASYFEKDWFDHLAPEEIKSKLEFLFPDFEPSLLFCDYHERVINLLAQAIKNIGLKPSHLIEVGSSLGRTFYEVCKSLPSIKSATLIEPSQNLCNGFERLFRRDGIQEFSFLKGNNLLSSVSINSESIKKACGHVDLSLINTPFAEIKDEIKPAELVICLNVIDQCKTPEALVEFLKKSTASNGVLILSCTYQWSKKHLESVENPITDVKSLFGANWKLIEKRDEEFRCRITERHWNSFLSEVLIYRRLN